MPNNELLTLTSENFVLDKLFFKTDFFSTQNTEKRNWFFKTFTSERSKIQTEFYDYITLHRSSMLFFDWFELLYASVHNIAYPFASTKHACPVTTRSKASTWNLSSGQVIESYHPPMRNLQIEHQNGPIEASPYKLPNDDTLTNTKNIILQNNFTNTNLGTLNAVSCLILTISLHFIGDPSHLKDKNAELLSNLRCKKLSDFQWYKNTFMTRVMLREDSNQPFWKEKFLAGLPILLGEKVRNKIKDTFSTKLIPYDQLTYGELVSFTQKEGLQICQDLKLQKHLNGSCSKSKHHHESKPPYKRSSHKYRKHYNSKYHSKEPEQPYYKKPYRKFTKHTKKPFHSNKPFDWKNATCFKCHQKGHTSKFCTVQKKLHELNIDEDTINMLQNLYLEASDTASSSSEISEEEFQVDELADSSATSDTSKSNEVSVLTQDQEFILEAIKRLDDPQLQRVYLENLLKNFNKTEQSSVNPHPPPRTMLPSTSTNTYDLTKILSKKKSQPSITIPELHSEIKTLKTELQSLKQAQQKDSAILQNLLSKVENQSDSSSEPESIDPDLHALHDTNLEQIDTAFLDVLSQISSKKYIVKLSLVFSDDFKLDTIALFDTGADLNCIKEGVVPKRFLQDTNEKLSAANSSKLDIAGKTQASVLNNGISVTTFFVATKDINHTIILGTPFIDLLTPYRVHHDCITSRINGIKLKFPFLEQSKIRNLNLIKACSIHTYQINALIQGKTYHLHDLQNHKEILSIVLCITKFQSDLLNQKFLLRVDCKSAKEVLQKDVQNLASKQIFARWQAILSIFDFDIVYIKGDTNSIPDYLTREFLQNKPSVLTSPKLLADAVKEIKDTKSWYDKVAKEEDDYSSLKNAKIEDISNEIVIRISKNPGLLEAINKGYRDFTSDSQSLSGSISKPLSKTQAGSSSSKPLLNLQNQVQVSTNFSKAKSKYFEKPKIQNIWTIEDGFPNHNVHATTASIFPKNFHFKSWDISKSQSFYENILQVTGSVTFKHFFKHPSHPDPAYSTCTIQRIISPDKWNIQKQNPHFPPYTYWDYEQAWFNAFLIQNQGNSHSWLFFFNTSIDTSSLPHWFQHWWDMFGCIPELLPEHPSVEEGFKFFKEAYQPIPSERHFKPITMFCAKFFLPWVCSWYYDYSSINGSVILIRRFRVKWWDAFRKEPQCSLKAVQDWFKNRSLPPAISQNSQSQFLAQKAKIAALLASAQTQEDYDKILQSLASAKEDESVSSNASSSSSASSPVISLGNDNEDDCYGILPPVKHSSKDVIKRR
ncbi:CTV [Salix suchowensis]|nr:CTV [Salix suchowensis]